VNLVILNVLDAMDQQMLPANNALMVSFYLDKLVIVLAQMDITNKDLIRLVNNVQHLVTIV
jgi:hypothetical protein